MGKNVSNDIEIKIFSRQNSVTVKPYTLFSTFDFNCCSTNKILVDCAESGYVLP